MTEGMLENLTRGGGGGRKRLWKSRREGGSEHKYTSSGVTFCFINVSITLIDKFAKKCYALSCFIILSNYGPLTTFILSFRP